MFKSTLWFKFKTLDIYSVSLPKKFTKKWNNLNLKLSGRKEIAKIRAEINEIGIENHRKDEWNQNSVLNSSTKLTYV